MKGYWLILGDKIADHEAQSEYGRLWTPIATKYDARIIEAQEMLELKERRDTSRVILVEFPNIEKARLCFDDPAYIEAAKWAVRASNRDLIIFEGDLFAR